MLQIGFNRQVDVAIFAVGITASYMLEPVSRHLAYLGFVFPKGVQLLFDLIESKGLVKQTNTKAWITFVILCGLYGLSQNRE